MEFYQTYESVFQNFSDEIKASEEGKEMAEKLNYFKQSKVGSIAPEFTVIDSNGKQLSLSDFKVGIPAQTEHPIPVQSEQVIPEQSEHLIPEQTGQF
ncbi:hypothetical protein D3C86_1086250 [compost metagenome]